MTTTTKKKKTLWSKTPCGQKQFETDQPGSNRGLYWSICRALGCPKRGGDGEQRGSVSSTHRTPKSFFHRAPEGTPLWKCSFRDVSRCAHGPPEASRFIRPTSTVALTAPAPGALSHPPWSKTPRYSDFSFLPPARSAPSQGTHDLRFPKDMAHVVGRAIMNITGILPIPASPEELCLGCRPLGLQGQVFLERGELPGGGRRPAPLPTAGLGRTGICGRGALRRECQGAERVKGLPTSTEVTTRGPTVKASSPRGLLDLGGDTTSAGALGGTSGSSGFLG